jgi:hypothetical protein
MLAADVSFLAVPGVVDPTTIVIYMSTLCAIGSLVISLVLAGQVNNNRRSSPGNVVRRQFLSRMLYLIANANLGHVHDIDV